MLILWIYIATNLFLLFNWYPIAIALRVCSFEADFAVSQTRDEKSAPVSSNLGYADSTIRLITPPYQSLITTFTPTFSWHPLKADRVIEYRLIIARPDARIIFDKWIGQDTTFTITEASLFEDLNSYYWTIYASYNNHQVQSPVWSFWIDQNVVTDLAISDMVLVNDQNAWYPGELVKIKVTVQNTGPIDVDGCYVTLYSGNMNRNYWIYSAVRKTIALDTVFIPTLKMNDPQSVILTASLPYGFNHFFARVDPPSDIKDLIFSNNHTSGVNIQTEDRIFKLKGLMILYKNYADPETGEKRLDQQDVNQLYQNLLKLRQYLWDHTHILYIQVDTLDINRLLTNSDFTYHDDRWGFFLSPDEVKFDLKQRNLKDTDYDFIFIFYSWWNSTSSWSGYSGYTFKAQEFFNKKIYLLAQPIIKGQAPNEDITIHEFFHFLDFMFEKSGLPEFYSPHHRSLYTTFEEDHEYFDWILETWPTQKWFSLKAGQILGRHEMDHQLESTLNAQTSKTLILAQNYPNPFNRITNIVYKIPLVEPSKTGIKVTLAVYDVLGHKIRTLVEEYQTQGTFRVYWDGKNQDGEEVSSGIYLYELKAGRQRQVKKLLYLR